MTYQLHIQYFGLSIFFTGRSLSINARKNEKVLDLETVKLWFEMIGGSKSLI